MSISFRSNMIASVNSLLLIGGAVLLSSAFAVQAETSIKVWHTLSEHNKKEFESLVNKFNRQNGDIKVTLNAFSDQDALDTALGALPSDVARPELIQIDESYIPDPSSKRSYLMPLHKVLNNHPIKGVDWFLPAKNSVSRDASGRLESFPFALDIPVIFYNLESFKKANINPPTPKRSWIDLQEQVVEVANNGSRSCPVTSDQPVSVNLESLAAVNNQPYFNSGKGKHVFKFDTLYIRHLSLMVGWVRSNMLVKPDFNDIATKRFADGECAILMSNSSNLGWFMGQRGLSFGVAGLPYYPEVTQEPGLPFIGGSSLWVTKGHSNPTYAAVSQFLEWLASPDQAALWYKNTGFLPITKEAFKASGSGKGVLGQWHTLVEPYSKQPVAIAHGFKINNYPEIRAVLNQTLDNAFGGKQSAVSALSAASAEAERIASK